MLNLVKHFRRRPLQERKRFSPVRYNVLIGLLEAGLVGHKAKPATKTMILATIVSKVNLAFEKRWKRFR